MKALFEGISDFVCLDKVFRSNSGGTTAQIARKLGKCSRQVKRIIEELRDHGLPIVYCKKKKTYFYEKDVFIKFEISVIDGDEKTKIVGGEKKIIDFFEFFPQRDILCPSDL